MRRRGPTLTWRPWRPRRPSRRPFLFLVASAGYFCQVEPYGLYAGGQFGWEWQISEWGVRFTYGVGSLCFVGGALVSFPELLSDS